MGAFIMAAGVLLLIIFVHVELKEENPVINIDMFRSNKAYSFSNIAAMLNYGATFAISYLISIYLQVIMGYTSQHAGMILIVSPMIQAVLSPPMGKLCLLQEWDCVPQPWHCLLLCRKKAALQE